VLGIEHPGTGPGGAPSTVSRAGASGADGADSDDTEVGDAGRRDAWHGGNTSNRVESGDTDGAAIASSAVDTAETDTAAPGLVSRAVDALLGVAL
jgi:hypothetical protein